MKVLQEMDAYGHEMVVFVRDKSVGLKAIIAVHNTTLGPALGGARFYNYASEEDALYDVLRLSRGMSLKNAAAGLKLGGGKAVIIGDPKKLKSRAFFHAFARAVNNLGGKYYTAEDVNTTTEDIAYINEITPYVTGTPKISGDPSPHTALGILNGIRAGAKVKFGSDDLAGKVIAIQGLGSVGYRVAALLYNAGAKLKVFDINQDAVNKAVNELAAQAVSAEEILITECDIFSPCAMGAVLNSNNVKQLKARVIAGCANNIFVDAQAAEIFEQLGGLYCPDYIINAGGVINCGAEITDTTFDREKITQQINAIYETTLNILTLAKKRGITSYAAADEYAMDIIRQSKK